MSRATVFFLRQALIALVIAGSLTVASAMADGRIEFELVTEKGFPLTGSHEWTRFLADFKLNRVRIRSGAGGEQPAIETSGPEATPTHYVLGVLTARSQLRLPGGTFSLRDKARLKDWILRLSQNGQESVTTGRAAFGLSGRQLVAVHQALAAKVRTRTKGQRVEPMIAAIARGATEQVAIDSSVKDLVKGESLVADELTGLASGTSLAAILRPLGLVFVPVFSRGGGAQLRVMAVADAPESWPVGWPSEARPVDLVPKLFERLEVEIADTPLQEVLDSVQQRLGVPLLVDHVALARGKIDPSQAQVSYAKPRTYYKRILDETTRQAGLKVEVRVDEAGQTFLWLTTRGP